MNNVLEDNLRVIADNGFFVEALRTLFEEELEKEKPAVNDTDDNSKLGEKYRAYEMGKDLLKKGFIRLEIYQTAIKKLNQFNKEN